MGIDVHCSLPLFSLEYDKDKEEDGRRRRHWRRIPEVEHDSWGLVQVRANYCKALSLFFSVIFFGPRNSVCLHFFVGFSGLMAHFLAKKDAPNNWPIPVN